MKILVKLPTKLRKEQFFKTLDAFYENCENKENTHYLITLDNDDTIMNTDEVKEKMSSYENLNFVFGDSTSKLFATNRDLELYQDWDIIILASDDTVPIVYGYDNIIRKAMIENFPDTDGVLHFNDGNQGSVLNTLPIMGKKYYDRFGYVQYTGYKSCYADNEFMYVSRILNKAIYFDQIIIHHQHPYYGYGQLDYAHHENSVYWGHDANMFNERLKINFDLK